MCLFRPTAVLKLPTGKVKRRESPYWAAQLRGPDGKIISVGTKIRNKRIARQLEAVWARCSEESRNGWLTVDKAKELLFECGRICKGDSLKQSERFIDSCLRKSIGAALLTPSVEAYFSEWMASKTATGRNSQSTLDRYSPVLDRFLVHLNGRRSARLDSITPADCRSFLHTEKSRGISAQSANQALKILRIAFSSARRDGLINSNPGEPVDFYQEDPHQRQAFTIEQVRSILEAADTEWKGMTLLGLYSGCRIGDAAKLTWANIDLENNLLVFRPQKTARTKKDVTVDLHRDLAAHIRGLQPGVPAAPLFPGLSWRPVGSANGLSARFQRLLESAGIHQPCNGEKRVWRPLSYHSLRHSFITQLSTAGVSIEVRKELAGHGSDSVSLNYTHTDRALTRAAINSIPSIAA